jgi:hypothetical protein
MLGGLLWYLCIGTILAQLIIVGYAVSRGHLDREKLADMLAVARGASLSTGDKQAGDTQAASVTMASIEEQDQRRTTMTRHLELREQAVTNALEQIASERDKLLKERQTFDMLVTAFRKEKEETVDRKLKEGEEAQRLLWEQIKPQLAKDHILAMFDEDQKDEIVAIFSAMPVGKQRKIAEVFKTDEEKKKLFEIMELIRQRSTDTAAPDASATTPSAPMTSPPPAGVQ